jgi:hypothetical protein
MEWVSNSKMFLMMPELVPSRGIFRFVIPEQLSKIREKKITVNV